MSGLHGYGEWLASLVKDDDIALTTADNYYNMAVDLHERVGVEPDKLPTPSDVREYASILEESDDVLYRAIYGRLSALRYYFKYNGELKSYEGVLHDLKQEYYVEPPPYS
jgi:hypothetical protein